VTREWNNCDSITPCEVVRSDDNVIHILNDNGMSVCEGVVPRVPSVKVPSVNHNTCDVIGDDFCRDFALLK
jgi:hypothetical protein